MPRPPRPFPKILGGTSLNNKDLSKIVKQYLNFQKFMCENFLNCRKF